MINGGTPGAVGRERADGIHRTCRRARCRSVARANADGSTICDGPFDQPAGNATPDQARSPARPSESDTACRRSPLRQLRRNSRLALVCRALDGATCQASSARRRPHDGPVPILEKTLRPSGTPQLRPATGATVTAAVVSETRRPRSTIHSLAPRSDRRNDVCPSWGLPSCEEFMSPRVHTDCSSVHIYGSRMLNKSCPISSGSELPPATPLRFTGPPAEALTAMTSRSQPAESDSRSGLRARQRTA
jgi:hypothetical protein